MPRRLPDDVVHRILIRLCADKPVPSIATAVGVANETVYRMQRNVELWGVPYPPPTVKLGRPRSLLPYQEEVIRCNIRYLNIIANSQTYRNY
jgi:transposase